MDRDPQTRLDELLAALAGGNAAAAERILVAHPDLAPLAGAARAVSDAASVTPAPDAGARHVRALMDEATRLAGPQVVGSPPLRRRTLRRSLTSVALLLTLLLIGAPVTAALASSAQPGQALYGTKLFVERVELVAHRTPSKRVALRLTFVQERLREIDRLVAQGRTGRVAGLLQRLGAQQGEIEVALARLERQGRVSPATVRELSAVAQQHQDGLRSLAGKCSSGALTGQQCAEVGAAVGRAAEVARILRRLELTGGGTSPASPAPGVVRPAPIGLPSGP